VVKELAQHLEEGYDTARARGVAESAAVEVAMQDVEDWRVLSADIHRATSQEGLVNNRTRSLWLPSLANFTAASLFLLALTQMSMQPQNLIRLTSGFAGTLYAAWLLSNVLCGALGAFLSRRAGGSITARIVAGMFPAIVLFGLWALVIPVSALVQNNAFVLRHPLYYAAGLFVWVVPPGMALLLGAAPFLKTNLEARTARVE
jgi:hypothetical protein